MATPKKGKKTAPKKNGAFKVAKKPVVQAETEGDAHKYEATREPAPASAYEDLGHLPESYGENQLFLIARDPHWLFAYWDFDWAAYPATGMKNGERKFFLKVIAAGGAQESVTEINPEARNWAFRRSGPTRLIARRSDTLIKRVRGIRLSTRRRRSRLRILYHRRQR